MTSKGNRIKLKEAYQKVNEKFESVLVFHVGESAGFFSEYNCMILVMLYCLQHKIQFKLYSRDANFGYEKGWTDFFESAKKKIRGGIIGSICVRRVLGLLFLKRRILICLNGN